MMHAADAVARKGSLHPNCDHRMIRLEMTAVDLIHVARRLVPSSPG